MLASTVIVAGLSSSAAQIGGALEDVQTLLAEGVWDCHPLAQRVSGR
jgi:hypothetical protein